MIRNYVPDKQVGTGKSNKAHLNEIIQIKIQGERLYKMQAINNIRLRGNCNKNRMLLLG
jgi:hypothetical protein